MANKAGVTLSPDEEYSHHSRKQAVALEQTALTGLSDFPVGNQPEGQHMITDSFARQHCLPSIIVLGVLLRQCYNSAMNIALVDTLIKDDMINSHELVETLEIIESQRVTEVFIRMLAYDMSPIRLQAVQTLKKLQSYTFLNGVAVRGLVQALEDKDYGVRREAALALECNRSLEAFREVIAAFGHKDVNVRRIAELALPRYCCRNMPESFRTALAKAPQAVQYRVQEAINRKTQRLSTTTRLHSSR